MGFRIIVDDSCIGCGICWTICPKGVFQGTLRRRVVVKNPEQCMGCFSCLYNCPFRAIRISYVPDG